MGIRATVVVRFVVNADKFTSGRLILSFQPGNPYYVTRRKDFRHTTQLPHVEIDLNTDTEVVLKIPHRGPYTHFDITNKKYDTGLFRITEYLPHRGNPYSWTSYVSFEDIDLLAPTAAETVSYQGNLEIEEKNVPLSTKVAALSSAATAASTVPLLSSFMAPLAWVTGVASNVLSAFGYSRPSTTVTPNVYLKRGVAKLNQTDGTDYADQMAMTTAASVAVSNQIGLTEQDEASFAFLCQADVAMFRFATTVLEPVGNRIFTMPLSPFNMKARSDINSAIIMHPMAFIANAFMKYRGSLKLTMEFAKTVFHSGRYLVVFEPINPEGVSIAPSRVNTISDAINCHKDIVDIRKGNTFEITFPFTSFVPYLSTERPYGYVHVFVLNALVTENATVPGTIDIGVKFAACSDMEFACPSDPRYWPYLPQDDTIAVNLGPGVLPETLDGISYESGLEVGDNVIVSKPIGSTILPSATTDMAALCIGEKILSLKQLAMRSKLVKVATADLLQSSNPFAIDLFRDTAWYTATGGVPAFKEFHDWYSYVGSLYQYVRGGVTVTFGNQSGGEPILVNTRVDNIRNDLVAPVSFPYDEFSLQHVIEPDSLDRVYFPPYNNSYVRYSLPTPVQGDTGQGNPGDYTWDSGLAHTKFYVCGFNEGQPTGGWKMWRAASDDTQYGGFMGTPYMILREPWNGASPADFKAESFFFPNT